jgi:tRNA modification GTPase
LVLVQAQDEDEQRSGSRLLAGGLAQRVDRARDALADVRALCEASLDFDESETGHVPQAELEALLAGARRELALALAEQSGRPAESGLAQVVLSGAPNAGKSQLFNALGPQGDGPGALVSPEPGTTRDSLRARLDLGGLALELWDTAGLATGQGPVERTAQAHASRERSSAELVLWVVDAAAPLAPAHALLAELDPRARVLLAWNKQDLESARPRPPQEWLADARLKAWVGISGRTGAGLPELRRQLARLSSGRTGLSRELAARHVQALRRSGQALEQGASALADGAPLELVAEHFREASGALDEILGTTTPEQVLERIFQRFCIGK